MNHNYQAPESDRLAEAGRQVIPAAMMSNFRRDIDAHPVYMSHGHGARLYDLDGNEYIDCSLSYGSALLGHSNEHVRQAIEGQLHCLHTPNVNALEVQAAQKVAAHVPSADLVRFACSGTGANWGALRTARAYTGRSMYVRFNGHYHGGLDHLLGGIVPDPEYPVPVSGELEDDFYSQVTNTMGRYDNAFNECFMIEWNDLPALERLLDQWAEKIAAVLMEPVMVNNFGCLPEPGYLEGVRALCTHHGVALIFDEVLTGFRIGLQGAQGYFGVTPDLTSLGKALGSGFPVSCFCGRREVMDTITRAEAVQGGTYNGHPLAMASVIASLEEYEKDSGAVFERIDRLGSMLKAGLDEVSTEHGQNLLLQGFPGAWSFTFDSRRKIINQADGLSSDMVRAGRFAALLKDKGVMTSAFRFSTSAAHTERDVGDVLDRANDVLKALKDEDVRAA
ncbi:aspartate aminotransferase family protein [Chloroflexota bacterium]